MRLPLSQEISILSGHRWHWEQDHERGEVEGEDPGGHPRLVNGEADGGGGGGGEAGVRSQRVPHPHHHLGADGQEGFPDGQPDDGGTNDACVGGREGGHGEVQVHGREQRWSCSEPRGRTGRQVPTEHKLT